MVNNAGYGAFYEWKQFPEDEIINQVNVLFSAPILLSRTISPLMEANRKGTIVNISSLATIYPLPYMPLYNAGKSGLSSFTHSMILESKFVKWIDFRLGDIKTDFNQSAPKQSRVSQNKSMKRAWGQIEKQLYESPPPNLAANKILRIISRQRSGRFYGGGFFQSRLAPFLEIFLLNSMATKILRYRYGI